MSCGVPGIIGKYCLSFYKQLARVVQFHVWLDVLGLLFYMLWLGELCWSSCSIICGLACCVGIAVVGCNLMV